MTDKKIVFGNLKMNFLYKDFCNYLSQLTEKYENETPETFFGIAIPYIYLQQTAQKMDQKFHIIAQDIHHCDVGAYTSSISGSQLASINIKWSLIGHSECRNLNQNHETISKKIASAFNNYLGVIYCCGKDPIQEIKTELKNIDQEHLDKLIIAFEPVASIGTGQALDDNLANEKLGEIKETLKEMWGEKGEKIKLLYGGSVNLENYKNYLEQPNIDGVLVGGVSLKVDQLWQMAMLK